MTYSKASARDPDPPLMSWGAHSPASDRPSSRSVVAKTKRNLSPKWNEGHHESVFHFAGLQLVSLLPRSMGKIQELMSRMRSILKDSLSQCNRLTMETKEKEKKKISDEPWMGTKGEDGYGVETSTWAFLPIDPDPAYVQLGGTNGTIPHGGKKKQGHVAFQKKISFSLF